MIKMVSRSTSGRYSELSEKLKVKLKAFQPSKWFSNIFSFSTGFLSILLMTLVTGVFSVVLRDQLGEEEGHEAFLYISMTALVISSIVSCLWVTGNPQLRLFTLEKMKTLFFVTESS